jgi:hypothetical protein
MAKTRFFPQIIFFQNFPLVPQRDPYLKKKPSFLKNLVLLFWLKNQPEKWSRLFFYLLVTQKYPEMFLMPFYAAGTFENNHFSHSKYENFTNVTTNQKRGHSNGDWTFPPSDVEDPLWSWLFKYFRNFRIWNFLGFQRNIINAY